MKEQDTYQLIDNYLNGDLTAEDKLLVEKRIETDVEFSETFNVLKNVYSKLGDKDALNFVNHLNELKDKYPVDEIQLDQPASEKPQADSTPPPSSNNFLKWLLPLVVVASALGYYLLNKSKSELPNVEPPTIETPQQEIDNTPSNPVEQPKEEIKEEIPEQKVEPKKEEKKAPPQIYAAADFETNEMLESMIGTTTRSGDLTFEVTQPQSNQNFNPSTKTISFSGKTNSSESQKGTFRLLNNKRIDVDKKDVSANGSFNFDVKISKPGLYYYTLKFGNKTLVGKFTVGKK